MPSQLLFATTILLSACLLFLVQPMLAKQILPWFGGGSAVWTSCVVFFQVLLLLGYAYAHASSRWLAPRTQAWVHAALLALSLAWLPVVPSVAHVPDGGADDAAWAIALVLAAAVGLPYLMLSTTGPLLQKWATRRLPDAAVYRLFAVSNAGSLAGLLAYPFVIEPLAGAGAQARGWSLAYALFASCCAASAFWSLRAPAPAAVRLAEDAVPGDGAAAPPANVPGWLDYAHWLVLSAVGSVLLLGATSHITQNIAAVPFLWVLPLALYLVSFVLAFEGRGGRGWYDRRWGVPLAGLFAVAMAAGLTAERGVLDVGLAIPLYALGVAAGCLFCHGELALRKPPGSHLTQFYLTLASGGAAGGLAVALLAPRWLDAYYELPLALLALGLLALPAAVALRRTHGMGWSTVAGIAALLTVGGCGYYGWEYAQFLRRDVVLMQRNFYGMLRVRETGEGDERMRRLLHGVILHGEQPLQGERRLEPGSYYAPSSGVGRALGLLQGDKPALRVGVVGLGVGTLAAYARAGDLLRFYELDPDVLALAEQRFDYLRSARGRIEHVVGDGRLSLERELRAGAPQRFDLLAVDAFSSDSIPVHLLTLEAVALYRRHLAEGGIVAVHISNRFLDLEPVLANIAAELGLTAMLLADSPPAASGASRSDWVLLAERAERLAPLAEHGELLAPRPERTLWTDRHSSLLEVLRASPREALRRLLPAASS
jgi:hypothetical protein